METLQLVPQNERRQVERCEAARIAVAEQLDTRERVVYKRCARAPLRVLVLLRRPSGDPGLRPLQSTQHWTNDIENVSYASIRRPSSIRSNLLVELRLLIPTG